MNYPVKNTVIYEKILENLVVYAPANEKVRYGHQQDGGYVIISGYDYDCFLSAGIANETTFEQDFILNNPNMVNCFAFDGSVGRPKSLPPQINYEMKNIGPIDSETTTNLIKYVEHYNDVFLKFDIEGDEYSWIIAFKNYFYKCKQIVFEAHAIFPDGVPPDKRYYLAHYENDCGEYIESEKWLDNIIASLEIINKTHFLVHAHQNADAPYLEYNGNLYPTFLELTYLRKDYDIIGINKTELPIKNLDFPSGRTDPEMLFPEGEHYDPLFGDKNMSFYPFVYLNKTEDLGAMDK